MKLITQLPRISQTAHVLLRNLSNTGRGRKQIISMAVDFSIAGACFWLALSLRFNEVFNDFTRTWHLLIIIAVVSVINCATFGVYRWVVRSSNLTLLRQLAKASIVSSAVLVLAVYLFPPDRPMPRSLFVIFGILLIMGQSSIRIFWQLLFTSHSIGEPVAIYGAGTSGVKLSASLERGQEFKAVVFIDDNKNLDGEVIGGIPVVSGQRSDIKTHLRHLDVNRVIFAMPSISAEHMSGVIEEFEGADFIVQTVPTTSEMLSRGFRENEVRDVSVVDILGRSEVEPDQELLSYCVKGKSVLVTGGGGSIGSELCRQILALEPSSLVVVDNSEFNLYQITEELNEAVVLRGLSPDVFKPVLCSVLETEHIREIVRLNKVDTVYHAAAYKHVPIVEARPEQGVRVNLFGTAAALDVAIEENVGHFVLISTDKAVRPTNAMGASKRAAELYLQAKASTKPSTRISIVRFGNVLGSSGSVVPKFTKQILSGGPITLTHPEITRFFMTIPEAAQLVLQAGSLSKGGDVFVLDMGEPVLIEDLARRMVRLLGKKLARDTSNANDIDILYTGIRPGEKLYEELFLGNDHKSTRVKKVFTTNEIYLSIEKLSDWLKKIERTVESRNRQALRGLLLELSTQGGRHVKQIDGSNDRMNAPLIKLMDERKKDMADVG